MAIAYVREVYKVQDLGAYFLFGGGSESFCTLRCRYVGVVHVHPMVHDVDV